MFGNESNGIECIGENNNTIIRYNAFIAFNKMAGIKVDYHTNIVIYKNFISKNCNLILK